MNVLVIDVGGTHVKILASGQAEKREFASGPKMTAQEMVSGVRPLAGDWSYDVVSIGYPGPVLKSRPVAEPHNLGRGWVGFHHHGALCIAAYAFLIAERARLSPPNPLAFLAAAPLPDGFRPRGSPDPAGTP